MNSCITSEGPSAPPAWAFKDATTRKARRPVCSSFARLMLLLLLQAKFSVSGEPPPASLASSTRTPPTREPPLTAANASCAFAGCASTVEDGTSGSLETTTYVATTTSLIQQAKDFFSTSVTPTAHEVVSAAPPSSSNRPAVRNDSSLGLSGGNASEIRRSSAQLGEVPVTESPRSSEGPKQLTTETTGSVTGGATAPERRTTTLQPPTDVTRAGKPPRRKFRKGQRRNGGGDRRNASLATSSSPWREETRFLWEPRDPVPVPGYAFGLAFGAVALAGLVGAGTMCGGGGAKPMLGTAWATAVTALVVTSAASRAAALLLLPVPPWRRLLQASSPAGLFLALALFWLALCRPALSRLVAAGVCFVALWVLPIVAESQAGALVDARLLLVTRLASLAAACLVILAALVAFPWLRRMALRSQDALLCSALAKMQDDAAEVPRRLPRPMARTTLRAALSATLLGLALALLLGHAALHAGQEAHPRWLWWTCRGLTLLAELSADACLAFAASRPAARCHAAAPTTATLLTPPGFSADAFGRPGGHRCSAIGARGDPSEAAALCDSQSPAKTGLLGHTTLQRTALLFHDQCVSSSVSTSRFCSAAGGSRDGTSSDDDGDDASHRALAGSTAPGTVDGSPWSQAHSSASFRRLGSSTCSSESAAHSFDLAWGGGGGALRPPQTLRLDLSTGHHHHRRGNGVGGAGDASEDVTPDSAVYVDLSPELRRSEGHSLDKLQSKGCPCCAARRPWRRAALQRYALSASRFSLSGYEPLRREDDCRCCAVDQDPLRQIKACAVTKEEWHRNLQSLPPPASSAF
ncbi:uncharacterized protein LOC119466393 [Dermacentor silvarum]|uniref:uncharacterized protein LOC119466393 n=1 Tax=Dermacentor silvarum TaxID=543639 RepID=UPI002101014F|nr:uncharacterized protein LOC119466393 [Dermacentor silvarum]